MEDELTPEMISALNQLQGDLQTVQNAFDQLDAANQFENSNQREQMAEAVKVALMNFVRAKNRILGESDATVASLIATAGQARKDIADALEDLQNIKATLNTITKAVNTVASVVATLA
jgi:hypothetical protein